MFENTYDDKEYNFSNNPLPQKPKYIFKIIKKSNNTKYIL